jgi:hypothetical protein
MDWRGGLAIVYRVALVGLCGWGIALNVFAWGGSALILTYYTIQSNIVVAVFFAYLIARRIKTDRPVSASIKGGVTVCITLTFAVYHFMLRPQAFEMGEYGTSTANALAHYVVPLMVIADWLLFDAKGRMKALDPVKWLVFPGAYLVFAMVLAQVRTVEIGSPYPYFFIDVQTLGVGPVILNCLAVAAGYTALGYVLVGLDRAIPAVWRRLRAPSGS